MDSTYKRHKRGGSDINTSNPSNTKCMQNCMQMCNRARSAYENTATRATRAADIANKWTSDAWHKMNSAHPSTRTPTDYRPRVTKYQNSPKVPSPYRNKMNEFYKKARQRANDTADTASLVASGTVKAARLGAAPAFAAGEAWLENIADEVWKGRGGKLNKKTRKRNKRKTRKKKFRKKRSSIKNSSQKKDNMYLIYK